MAKTYEELLEQAAIIRDETAAGKNTATRVGGTITDAVDYVKELQDTYAGIHAEAAEAKKTAETAQTTATSANKKNEEQDNRIANAEAINTKQNERLLNYVYPKLYQINEGAGARKFHGFTEESGALKLLLTKDTYQYRVLYSTKQKQFVLRVIDTAIFANPTVGTFAIWDKIDLPNGSSIASSPSYAQRDRLYYIYVEGEGSTYYYIDSNGVATEQSATYLLRRLVDKNTAAIDALQGNVVGPGGGNSDYGEQIKELGEFDTFAALLEKAAKFYIVSNNAIALLHGTYKNADVIYNGVLILQQVEKNSDGSGTAMQYIYNQNKQFTRSITFSATNVTSVQPPQNDGARNLSLSGRVLQMTNMWGDNVGSGATIPDNGNIYEGTAGASSVPITIAKTFGGTATATLGAATSARAGVMTVDHVNKIKKLEERVLQYLYPKLYQLNEGAGARPFDGIYDGNASVSTDRKEAVEEGCTYKVVFKLGSFYLQEISPGGTTVCLYSGWDKIISARGSSEDYTRRDCLYYVYTEGEGSYYYYVDADGNISEQSGTYLLRKLIDETKSKIASVESAATVAQELLDEVREAMITTISVDGDAEGVNLIVENELTHTGISMKIPNADVRRNKAGVVTGTEINALYEIDFAAADVTNIGFEKDAEKNKITLTGIGQLGSHQDGGIELTPATSELAGLMSAADKAKFETVDWQELLAYGISFNSKDAEPDCTRIGNPSLHRTLPIQSKMRGGTLLPGGEFTPFVNVDDWTSEVRDGSAGDVMVEIPEHYIKFVAKGTIEKGQSREIWLSEYPLPGFKLVPKVYVSAYECAMYHPEGVSTSNYKIRSVVNLTADYRGGDGNPSYDEDATASRLGTACPANKYYNFRVNPVEGFSFYDYAVHKSIYWLMCVEYGTRNIHKDFIEYRDVNGYMQGGLGTTAIYAKLVKVGVSDTYGNRSGVVSTTSVDGATIKVPRYRGIEFPFGNYGKELKGLAFAVAGGGSTNVYVTKDGRAAVGTDEADGTHNEFGNQEEWTLICTITSSKQVLAYISDIHFCDRGDIIPISIEGGGSGKYYCEQTVFYSPTAVGNLTASVVGIYGLLDIRINAGGILSSDTSCRRIIYYPNKQNKS